MGDDFPTGFRWGTATAAHQVEGGNWNNDWWAFEHADGSGCEEPSGDACDQLNRYDDDIALLAALGFDHYRFSVEWSRIEPEPGEFSLAALDHYRRVCASCRAHGVEPVVTLHHFTNPRWVTAAGGWHTASTVEHFLRFAARTVEHLGDLVGRSCTINEPNVVAFMGYQMGMFPPGVTDDRQYRAAMANFLDAHERVVPVLKSGPGDFPVGLTLSMTDFQAVPDDDPAAQRVRTTIRADMEDPFLELAAADDFLGVQTYSRQRLGPNGVLGPEPGVPVLPMGYELWPASLEACLRRAWEVTGGRVPLHVTENGIGTDDDAQRVGYVRAALEGVQAVIADGVDVRSYTYWSLLDNFEWAFGYRPRFGIVAVDRATQRRVVKPSGEWLGAVARANSLAGA
jgi:beta-glucosidase